MVWWPIWFQVEREQCADMRQRGAVDKGRTAISSPIQLPAGTVVSVPTLSLSCLCIIIGCIFWLGFATAILCIWFLLYGPAALTDIA